MLITISNETRSLVGFDGDTRKIGEDAVDLAVRQPADCASNVKQLIALHTVEEVAKWVSCKACAATPVPGISLKVASCNENMS